MENNFLVPSKVITDGPGVQVEIYRSKELGEVSKPCAEGLIAKRQKLCSTLGLDRQVELFEKETGVVNFATKLYHEIRGYELYVWRQFLPTRYSHCKSEWKGYQFDVIPTTVLEEVETAKSLRIFNDLQIWTPERNFQDPIAVGVIIQNEGSRIFLISRWSESLKSLKEIEEEVLNGNIKNHTGKPIPEKIRGRLGRILMEHSLWYVRRSLFHYCCQKRMYKAITWWEGKNFFICEECERVQEKKQIFS